MGRPILSFLMDMQMEEDMPTSTKGDCNDDGLCCILVGNLYYAKEIPFSFRMKLSTSEVRLKDKEKKVG